MYEAESRQWCVAPALEVVRSMACLPRRGLGQVEGAPQIVRGGAAAESRPKSCACARQCSARVRRRQMRPRRPAEHGVRCSPRLLHARAKERNILLRAYRGEMRVCVSAFKTRAVAVRATVAVCYAAAAAGSVHGYVSQALYVYAAVLRVLLGRLLAVTAAFAQCPARAMLREQCVLWRRTRYAASPLCPRACVVPSSQPPAVLPPI